MSEVGKSLELADQKSINGILNDVDDRLSSMNLTEVKMEFGNVESAANRISAALLTMA